MTARPRSWSTFALRGAHTWHATDLRRAVHGQEWTAAVAVGCLAFTTAITCLFYASVTMLTTDLRQELALDQGELVEFSPATPTTAACPLDAPRCDHAPTGEGSGRLRVLEQLAATAASSNSALARTATLSLNGARRTRTVDLIGVPATIFALQPIAVTTGRPWTRSEERAVRPVALLGERLVDSLWSGRLPLRIRVRGTTLTVLGSLRSGTTASLDTDDAVLVPPWLFVKLASPLPSSATLYVRAVTGDTLPDVRDVLRVLERRSPRLRGQIAVTTSADRLGEVAGLHAALQRGVSGLAVVLVLASLVAVSALMITITRAHHRSVGVTRALGATRALIAMQGAYTGVIVGGAGVVTGWLLAAIGMMLLPWLLGVSCVMPSTAAFGLLVGAAPSLVVAVLTSTAMFTRLAYHPPARLLA